MAGVLEPSVAVSVIVAEPVEAAVIVTVVPSEATVTEASELEAPYVTVPAPPEKTLAKVTSEVPPTLSERFRSSLVAARAAPLVTVKVAEAEPPKLS